MMNAATIGQPAGISLGSAALLPRPVDRPLSTPERADNLASGADDWLRLVEQFQDLTWQTLVPAFLLVATLVFGALAAAQFLASSI